MKESKGKIMILIIILMLSAGVSYVLKINTNKENNQNNNLIKIAIVFNKSGLGDKSFNDLCYDGALKSQEELNIEFDYAQSNTSKEYETLCREYAKTNEYDLIIAVSGEEEDSIKKVAKEFTNQKFTIIDSKLELSNVSSISTKHSEQTFLNGVIAGLAISKQKGRVDDSVGIVLGKDLDYLKQGAVGFEAGVRYINPKIKTITAVVDDFSNPAKAKEISLLMYSKGVSYIQHIAGESGLGVFAAAKEVDKYAFGVDGNQNLLDPDYIVSTATKYANKIIYEEIESIVNNTWTSGRKELGLKDNVIGYTREGSNVNISNDIIDITEDIKKSIINKEIIIPSTHESLENWIKSNKYTKY
ncbi:MAG: BMP family ABC transporter substrate-binding protein [Terrisporobacter sp.]|uniref:BMP family lipoprotein n=1 Tax=Terrisporobacter sp. TaxID=1965305 RepID=UPI002FCBA1DB